MLIEIYSFKGIKETSWLTIKKMQRWSILFIKNSYSTQKYDITYPY